MMRGWDGFLELAVRCRFSETLIKPFIATIILLDARVGREYCNCSSVQRDIPVHCVAGERFSNSVKYHRCSRGYRCVTQTDQRERAA